MLEAVPELYLNAQTQLDYENAGGYFHFGTTFSP
jgi:hypothetical protein